MTLYKTVQHRLSAYCRVVAGTEEKASDLIQETLTAAFENFHTLRDPEAFQFYLIGIARNCHLKQQRRWKFFENQSDKKLANILDPSESIEINYDIQLVHKNIARLNPEQRESILLFHIMGFSIKEIAENLTISDAAVKNRLVRGRTKLRKLLSDSESGLINRISANTLKSLVK